MGLVTVVFGPNDRTGGLASFAGIMRIARCGGTSRNIDEDVIANFSNETTPRFYPGSPDVAAVGLALYIGEVPPINKEWRTHFRFLLRPNTLDISAIVSGPTPQYAWWPFVTSAKLRWFNGDKGPSEGGVPAPDFTTSDLRIRMGRQVHTPTGGTENPFGRNQVEAGATFLASSTFGENMVTLPWAQWGIPERDWKEVAVSQSVINTYLKTVTDDSNAFIDAGFQGILTGPGTANFTQEIAAWGFNPEFHVTFDLPTSMKEIVARSRDGIVDVAAGSGGVTPRSASGEVDPRAGSGSVLARARAGEISHITAPAGAVVPRARDHEIDARFQAGAVSPRTTSGEVSPTTRRGEIVAIVDDVDETVIQ